MVDTNNTRLRGMHTTKRSTQGSAAPSSISAQGHLVVVIQAASGKVGVVVQAASGKVGVVVQAASGNGELKTALEQRLT